MNINYYYPKFIITLIQISLLLNGYIKHNNILYIKIFERIISPKPCYYPKYINALDKPIEWYWPTISKVIIDSKEENSGIDIFGIKGQPIFSIAKGKVVYTGNALCGYGNLIIIKHENNYLSTYAHNDTIIVFAKEEVQSGQKIATMGSTGTSSVKLHLEIHYKGYTINPMRLF